MCDRCGGMTDDQYSQRLEQNILTYGWTVQFVEGDGVRNPAFGYTLGLSLREHPEIIVFDPDPSWVYLGVKPLAWAVMDGAEIWPSRIGLIQATDTGSPREGR